MPGHSIYVRYKLNGLWGIGSVHTSIYHPQTEGLVERLNKTIKSMIHKFVHDGIRRINGSGTLMFAVKVVPRPTWDFQQQKGVERF